MQFKNLKGRTVNKIVSNCRINWDKECRSNFQKEVKNFLKEYWANHICYEEFPCAGTRLSLDFVNLTKRIAVEVQGKQHQEFVPFFHGSDRFNFLDQITRDLDKEEWCNINGITLVEIHPSDMPLTKEWFKTNYEIEL